MSINLQDQHRKMIRNKLIDAFHFINIPRREPIKKSEAGMAGRNLRSQMRLHSAMVELVFPPIHSQVPSGNPQTEAAELRSPSHKEPVLHLQEDG